MLSFSFRVHNHDFVKFYVQRQPHFQNVRFQCVFTDEYESNLQLVSSVEYATALDGHKYNEESEREI